MRHIENLKKKRGDRYGANKQGNGWQIDIVGALGEMALAKALGFYWEGKGRLSAPDVGPLQVRTCSDNRHHLLLHPGDDDDRRFYLVVAKTPHFEIAGWILGRDGKRDEFWQERVQGRPAYFVPPSALNHPES